MANYIVTVKLPKNPKHDPHNKVIGQCPTNVGICTDVTGEHHSILIDAPGVHMARELAIKRGYNHITRIERVG